MTKEDLTRLDNYGHKDLSTLTLIHLLDYAILLQMRSLEILERILGLRKGGE